MPEFTKPEYPKILTRKDWDKNKGIIAKMHGETGIGAKMDEVQQQYDAVDWEVLNLTKRRENWRWGGEGVLISKSSWDDIVKDAKAEITGRLAKVSKALYELRDLAQEVKASFKKSKTIPSASVKHVEKIATEADRLGVQLNKNSMSAVIQEMEDEFMAFVQKNFLDVWPTGLKKYLAKHVNVLDGLRENPTPQNFGNACQGMCRDYTTALGNISKSHDKGFKVKNGPAAQKLFEALTPYANLQVNVKDEDEVKEHLPRMEKLCAAVKVFANAL